MSPESQSSSHESPVSERLSMSQFMEVEAAVLSELFGENDDALMDWLSTRAEHGERLRELIIKCYSEAQHSFPNECIAGVVDVLRQEIDVEKEQLH